MKKITCLIFGMIFINICIIFYNFIPKTTNNSFGIKNDSIELLPEHPYYLLEEVNDTILYKTLIHYQFPSPEIITAQAVLETGNFKSRLCIDGNNLFGLYNSSKKQYFKFDSWISCVLSYKEFILNRYSSEESYLNYLKRIGYAEDPNYIKKVHELSKKYKSL